MHAVQFAAGMWGGSAGRSLRIVETPGTAAAVARAKLHLQNFSYACDPLA